MTRPLGYNTFIWTCVLAIECYGIGAIVELYGHDITLDKFITKSNNQVHVELSLWLYQCWRFSAASELLMPLVESKGMTFAIAITI